VNYASVGPFHIECDESLRRDLGRDDFDAACNYGGALSLTEAVGVALRGSPLNNRQEFAGADPSEFVKVDETSGC
jgi:hypothetical protein